MEDYEDLLRVATSYFDGLYDGDVDLLSSIFHDRARLHVMLDGKLSEIECAPYLDVVRNRASPRSLESARKDEIKAIVQTSSDTAIIIASLLLSGKSYTDQLSLIKDNGEWRIMSKIYHYNGIGA